MPHNINGELPAEKARWICSPQQFSFESTAQLSTLEEVIGQERAVRSLMFGIDIGSPGYHLFALGTTGTGKTTTIRKLLSAKARRQPTPDDWCYVHNFEDGDKPRAVRLPAGKGCEFRTDVDRLVEEMKAEIPRAFEREEYQKEKERIQQEFQKRHEKLVSDLKSETEERSFTLAMTPQGPILAPVKDGEPMSPDEWNKLDEETQHRIESEQKELQGRLGETTRAVQRLQKEIKERIRDLDRQMVALSMDHMIEELGQKYADFDAVTKFLQSLRADVLDRVDELKQLEAAQQAGQQNPLANAMGMKKPAFEHYRVNLIVDNSGTEGAPVVVESNPTAHNLIGRMEHEARFGALTTHFSMLKAGALHRANGGYLMIDARDVLIKPFSWETLKRALKNREIKIENVGQEYMMIATRGLEPQPIPLDVKVILVGDPWVYYLVQSRDEEFRELFKVKADFAARTDRTPEMLEKYASFIGTLCEEEKLTHFSPSGVGKIVEEASRMASDQTKLATRFADVVDLIRESSYWAGRNGNDLVQAGDVQQAVQERVYRSSRVKERIQEMIRDGSIMIETEGSVVGQVNGVSVLSLGDYAFGKPTRITARTYVGGAGVVNIDRESKLGGRIHNKGVMILAGYLGGKFALEVPMALSGSITFEQLYEEVEGDSAASAELYALLSSLSELPTRQDLAVTGSVNQRGQIQAIGGVNEKIEGYFDTCRVTGFTGSQGVIIPEANIKHLMLREDIVEAIREGQFHIYPVSSVDEGFELLSGRSAGVMQAGRYPEGTFNRLVQERLEDLAHKGKGFVPSASFRSGDVEASGAPTIHHRREDTETPIGK